MTIRKSMLLLMAGILGAGIARGEVDLKKANFAPDILGENKAVVRVRYQKPQCQQATDLLDGRPLRWLPASLSKCGFDTTKPPRREMTVLQGSCIEARVWDSKTGFGQHTEIFTQPRKLEDCGYDLKNPTIEYVFQNGSCQKHEILHSSMANMQDITMAHLESADMTACGFKPEGARTLFEIKDDQCYQSQVNFNPAGQRIQLASRKVKLSDCGVDTKAAPAASMYVPRNDFRFPWSSASCSRIDTFVSSKGLGPVQLVSKESDQAKCENESISGSTGVPSRAIQVQ